MSLTQIQSTFVAIACGGTGGHLFPGIAVADELKKRGCSIALLISPKEIDRQAAMARGDAEIFSLPAVGLQNRNYISFVLSFWRSYRAAKRIFKLRPPLAVVAMGGFTSVAPVFAAKKFGAKTFLHESNSIPGRANRFLARFVDEGFVGFPETAGRLNARKTSVTGTPVRTEFSASMAADRLGTEAVGSCAALGLDPGLPTVLVVGGSQGASGLNEMILSALPLLAQQNWQWLHLTGAKDYERVKEAYSRLNLKAAIRPFLREMHAALGTATVAVSRAGASSLAEMAAMRLPSILVPFPAAADNHQFFNALAFEKRGAATLIEQKNATPGKIAAVLVELMENPAARSKMQDALAQWDAPWAATEIAERILDACSRSALALQPDLGRDAVLRRPIGAALRRYHIGWAVARP